MYKLLSGLSANDIDQSPFNIWVKPAQSAPLLRQKFKNLKDKIVFKISFKNSKVILKLKQFDFKHY